MESELTARQKKIFNYIRRHIDKSGYGPTVREIAAAFDIASPNGFVCHLDALVQKGFIVRKARKSRSIEISPEYQEETRGLPLAGEVAAGAMHEAIEQDERIDFDRLLNKRGAFALQVRGESMIEAQICDGDFVIVHPSKKYLATLQLKLSRFLQNELHLKIHPKKVYLQHYKKGVKFVGAVIKPNRIYIANRTKGNMYDAISKFNAIARTQQINPNNVDALLCSMNSYLGIMKHYKPYKIRKIMKWW